MLGQLYSRCRWYLWLQKEKSQGSSNFLSFFRTNVLNLDSSPWLKIHAFLPSSCKTNTSQIRLTCDTTHTISSSHPICSQKVFALSFPIFDSSNSSISICSFLFLFTWSELHNSDRKSASSRNQWELIPGSQRQQEGETAVETRKVADKREAKKSCPVKKIVIQSN